MANHIDIVGLTQLEASIRRLPGVAETLINDYLHGDGAQVLAEQTTKLIPKSNVQKVHARDIKWWNVKSQNLGVSVISKGGAANKTRSTGYLVFPDEGRGPFNNVAQDFTGRGLRAASTIVVDRLGTLLQNRIQEVL